MENIIFKEIFKPLNNIFHDFSFAHKIREIFNSLFLSFPRKKRVKRIKSYEIYICEDL